MSDVLATGDSDLATVACSVVVDRLSGISIDGIVFPAILSPVYPAAIEELPVICVTSPTKVFSQTAAGRRGQRPERIDVTIRATVVAAAPASAKDAMAVTMGKVAAEIRRRLSADVLLSTDGVPLSTDIAAVRTDEGFAEVGSKPVFVAQHQFTASIWHREGDDSQSLFVRD